MGGRKQRRPVRTKPLPTIPKIFDCPRCEATAIRISFESDLAIIECGSCHLKQTITEVKSIEEAIDIYGNFLDIYYLELETAITEETSADDPQTQDEKISEDSVVMDEFIEGNSKTEELREEQESEETDEEPELKPVEKEPQTGFIPRSKGDVLKNKQKPKEKK